MMIVNCPWCRYDLSGLPADHICPECGTRFDRSDYTVEAWETEELPSLFAMLFPTMIAIGGASICMGSLRHDGFTAFTFGSGFAAICGLAWLVHAIKAYKLARDGIGAVWLVIKSDRLGISDGVDEITYRWEDMKRVRLSRYDGARWRLQVSGSAAREFFLNDVDVVFRATQADAEAIERLVRRHVQAAAAPGAQEPDA